MFNLFGNSSFGRLTDGGIIPHYTPSRDDRKRAERTAKSICSPLGNLIEKCNNVADSVENVGKSISPLNIVVHKLTDKSVDEAKRCFEKGDHIAVQRAGYSHHGIYDGNGYVYEYNDYVVRYVSLHDFANDSDVYEFKEAAAYSPSEIVRRASSRLGENKYNIAFNNCQNFATWCRCG